MTLITVFYAIHWVVPMCYIQSDRQTWQSKQYYC